MLEILTHLRGLCMRCSYSFSDCVGDSFQAYPFLVSVVLVDEQQEHPCVVLGILPDVEGI
jgi:hypothetical protein